MSETPTAPRSAGGRSLLRAAFTVGGLTLASRILGFIRDVAIAAVGGAGVVTDAFFIALAIPNFFRRLFGEGAFSAAFTPMFAGRLETDGHAAARAFAERALAVLLPALLVLVAAMEFGAPQIIGWIWLDPVADPDRYALAVAFARVTLIYLLFICLVAMFGGVLNALDRFAAMAAAPILFNLCLIVAAALHAALGFGATVGHALAWAVAVSGVAQLILMLVCARRE
ncbi:MAG: lipid II flippase MurJ, partial [Pseudomonadota bacterium]